MLGRTYATALAALILCANGSFLSGCKAPGEGANAGAGYEYARPVIAALKHYHDKRNEYPAALRDLVPDYLSEAAWKSPEGTPASEFFEYKKSDSSYRLLFKYTGPGSNLCLYTPESAKWECTGHY